MPTAMANEEMMVLNRLLQEIEDLKLGLDPNVLQGWYNKIASDAKAEAPRHLMDSIDVIQDPILPMKFEFKTSRRAIKYVQEAIDRNLNEMPLATRLYFQKLSELIEAESMR
ncbi:MAG TPA: hypothetical protein VKF39_03515 [Nitrososphaerales archaeon]|nr:hypothetical protein [Nitrososphaerales archaeon]